MQAGIETVASLIPAKYILRVKVQSQSEYSKTAHSFCDRFGIFGGLWDFFV